MKLPAGCVDCFIQLTNLIQNDTQTNSRFAAVARRAVAKLRQNGSGAGPVRELEALQKKVRELAERIEELQGRDA